MNNKAVTIVGQGYVGLPLAQAAARAGWTVHGLDVTESLVAALNDGTSHVDDLSDADIREMLDLGYRATTDPAVVSDSSTVVICVPTPLGDGGSPDLGAVKASSRTVGDNLTEGTTVILESTTYPGTTDEIVKPILEMASGLTAGDDFQLAYSPERVDPGRTDYGIKNTPKLMGGMNDASTQGAVAFYGSFIDNPVPMDGMREAETAKLLENTFRHVNIALVNELAAYANDLGVNVWEAIEAASTKPFGFMKFTPGPGVGGHCLPIDPSYLSWKVKTDLGRNFRFVELANDINDHMPDYVVQRSMNILNLDSKALRGSKVIVVGVAYKKDSGDSRESPALRVIELLHEYGAEVSAVDSLVEEHRWPAHAARVELTPELIADADLAVVITDHSDIEMSILENAPTPVFDTRNCLTGTNVHRL